VDGVDVTIGPNYEKSWKRGGGKMTGKRGKGGRENYGNNMWTGGREGGKKGGFGRAKNNTLGRREE